MAIAISTARSGEERAALDYDVLEVPPLHVLHDQVVRAVLDAPVVDVHDVGLVEVGGRLRLLAEPLYEDGVLGELRVQYLDGDGAAEQRVPGAVHVRHAAAADELFQLVTGVQYLSDHVEMACLS
jgi:hypothetical protein